MLAEIAIARRRLALKASHVQYYDLLCGLLACQVLAIDDDGLFFLRPLGRFEPVGDVLNRLVTLINDNYQGRLDHLPPEWIELASRSPN